MRVNVNVNVTIVPPESCGASPLAITATLSGANALGSVEISASALKEVIFQALAVPLPPDLIDKADDTHHRGTTPVVLALEAAAGPVAPTVFPLVTSAAIRTSIHAILERGRDYWAIEYRGNFIIQDHEALGLRVDQPAHDIRLVPLHTLPPPPFVVVSNGTRKLQDAFGKTFVAYRFHVRHANLQWSLTKRFFDFVALHERLRSPKDDRLHGLTGAPSLPPLPARWPNPSSEEAIDGRRLKLEGYLQALVALPDAMENPHVLGFLGVMNPRTDLPLSDPLQPGRKRQVVHLCVLPTTLQWGDIVLFRCAHVYAGLQRAVTRAEWDHVGLVVGGGGGGVGGGRLDLLECTGEGVTRTPLKGRIAAYGTEFTQAIAIRRLEGPRTAAMRDALHKFAQEAVGKPYGLLSVVNNLFPWKRAAGKAAAAATAAAAGPPRRPPGTILERLLRTPSETEERRQAQQVQQKSGKEEDEYFCSQLVAAGLKAMGVVPADLNSSRFWPGSFAQAGDIDGEGAMLPGWHFGEVILVDTKTLEVEAAVLTTV